MTTRTIRQMGIAFGDQPVDIVAKVGNTVVYQGPVTTLNEDFPTLPNMNYVVSNELFSWTTDVTFEGPEIMEIEITGQGSLLVAQLETNYCAIANGNETVSTGATGFVHFDFVQFGNTYINGILVSTPSKDHRNLGGMWWWRIPSNGTFVENFDIVQGFVEM